MKRDSFLDIKSFFVILTSFSSLLLFLVQPMCSKKLLPILGGSPQVWNVCLLFFQAALLVGYGYVHGLTSRFRTRIQIGVHLGFLCLALGQLNRPFFEPHFQAAEHPVLWLLSVLTANIALPFICLSASAPLIQKWFSETNHPDASNPYELYSASNLGSLGALISYPFIFERLYSLEVQRHYWGLGFVVLCVLFLFCSFLFMRSIRPDFQRDVPQRHCFAERLSWKRLIYWILLAFVSCSLMMGVTTHITTDVAAIPLLWIIPLAVYLLSFIVAFSKIGAPFIRFACWFFPYVIVVLVLMLALHVNHPFWLVMGWNILSLAVMTLCCHGQLARDKPFPKYLTLYYLCISAGGVLGGIFNAIIAPMVFKTILEYSIAIILACFLYLQDAPSSKQESLRDVLLPSIAAGIILLLRPDPHRLIANQNPILQSGVLLAPAVLCFAFRKRPVRFATFVAFLLFLWCPLMSKQKVLYTGRSFFGVHRVLYDAQNQTHLYYHGTTNHGIQFLDSEKAKEPTAYFHKTGPVGELFYAYKDRWHHARVGVVGLGVGILASYAESGQEWTFIEIDKAVQNIAEKSGFFTYLKNAAAPYKILLGDGRLLMDQQPNQTYDVLFLDAFSSDSVPIHLLTREAIQLYFKKMRPGGVVMFNISNRNLDFRPVLGAAASSLSLAALVHCDTTIEPQYAIEKYGSCWVVLARNASDVEPLVQTGHWGEIPLRAMHRTLWTDDYSNIFDILNLDFEPSFGILKDI